MEIDVREEKEGKPDVIRFGDRTADVVCKGNTGFARIGLNCEWRVRDEF